jgi:hypothetical protein
MLPEITGVLKVNILIMQLLKMHLNSMDILMLNSA